MARTPVVSLVLLLSLASAARATAQGVRLGGARNVELSTEVFNLLNADNYTEYSRTGPNRIYNPQSYLTYTNPQTPRAATLQIVFRF
jgi:hypothetical protein